jgi:hypothetical protein
MSIVKVRKPESPFEIIDRASIESIRNIDALAIWIYLRAKPEGWVVRESEIRSHFWIGRDKYRAAVRYLCEAGAVVDARIRGKNGQIAGRELIVNFSASFDWIQTGKNSTNSEEPSSGAGSDRKPEIPSFAVHRAPEIPVARDTPCDGSATCIENTHVIQKTDSTPSTHCDSGGGDPDATDAPTDLDPGVEPQDPDLPKPKARKRKNFVAPTLDEVCDYAKSRSSQVDPKVFHEYFTAGNWHDRNGDPVFSWKQKFLTWESMGYGQAKPGQPGRQAAQSPYQQPGPKYRLV